MICDRCGTGTRHEGRALSDGTLVTPTKCWRCKGKLHVDRLLVLVACVMFAWGLIAAACAVLDTL